MEQSASSGPNPSQEQRRVATAYLVWPLAFAELIRESEIQTLWTRLHTRQALVFGILSSLLFIVILAFPLVAVVASPAISTSTTIAVYTGGLLVDVVYAIAVTVTAVRFSARAARGELFEIPIVSQIVDTFLPVRRP